MTGSPSRHCYSITVKSLASSSVSKAPSCPRFLDIHTHADIYLGYFGHHVVDASPAQLLVTAKLGTFTQYPYGLSLGLARCSICMLLIRIFFVPRFKITAYSVLALNVLWMAFIVIATSTKCLPFEYNWNKNIAGGRCIDQNAYLLVIAVWSVVVDVCIFALPIPMIWNLHMPTRRKFELSIIFGLWFIDILISVFRIVSVQQLNVEDITWSGVSTALWAVAEPSVAILVACAPIYQVFFDRASPRRLVARLHNKFSRPSTHDESRDPPLLDSRDPKFAHHPSSDNPPQLAQLELGHLRSEQSSS
ncbi:MAG: hypothetical protein Q9204_004873 [Flavoplaca sp. TL-2023a]